MDNSIGIAVDYENLKKNYSKLNDEHERMKQELHDCKRNLKMIESIQNDYKNEIDMLQSQEIKQKQRYQELIKQLEQNITDIRTSYSEEKQSMEYVISIMEEKNEMMQSKLKALEDCNSTKFEPDPINGLINDIMSETLEHENETLKLKLKELEHINENIYKKLQENTLEVESLKDALQNNRSELLEAKSNNQSLTDRNICLRSELESIKSTPLENNSKGNSLFAEVDDRRIYLQDKIDKINSAYLKLTQEKNQLQNTIRHLKFENLKLLEKWKTDICEIDDDDDQLKSSLRGTIIHLEKVNEKYKKELEAKPWILDKTGFEEVEFFSATIKEKNDEIKSLREMGVRQSLYQLSLNNELTDVKAETRKWRLAAIARGQELELFQTQLDAYSQDPGNENSLKNEHIDITNASKTTENTKSVENEYKAVPKGQLSDIQEGNLLKLNIRTEKSAVRYEVDKENISSADQSKRVTFANNIPPKETKNCKTMYKTPVQFL